ncbi:MAG: FMN-binding protein [Oscillospiraceae bacterium]|nr:FMN-binding protein [Oscillospiraceae bacterium]
MEAAKKNNSLWTDMLRPVVVLVVICLVASAALGFTNSKTAPIIEENKNAAAVAARRTALPAAEGFDEIAVSDELAARGVTGIYKSTNDVGYVVTAANKGYGGDVVVTVGFDPAGTILNVDADVSTETQGVGSKVGERTILDRFTGLSGSADDVTLRSGATYTSNAVRSSVNAAFAAVSALIG